MWYCTFLAHEIKVLSKTFKLRWKIVKFILKKKCEKDYHDSVRNVEMTPWRLSYFDNLKFCCKIGVFCDGFSTGEHRVQACSSTAFNNDVNYYLFKHIC